ncbi:MAG: hypothetical protein M1491_10265 [Deltaproteobacteria bacterium]|nr:hypothetical protein [Deltaproteobacteria bacterium]MCL5277587.1 hypothetical protein [Deltaproteobacteria bacterium]
MITRTIGVTETRTAYGPAGRMVLHEDVSLDFTAQDTLSSSTPPVSITQRIMNGTGVSDHHLLKILAATTVTDLTYQQGYCHPVSGTIVLALSSDQPGNAYIGTYALVFTTTDGTTTATLNGNPITLNPCD